MRKIVSLILILSIVFSLQIFAYSDSGTEFPTKLTKFLNESVIDKPSDWEDASITRAILAQALILDLLSAADDLEDSTLSNFFDDYSFYSLEDGLFFRSGRKSSPIYFFDIPMFGSALTVFYTPKEEKAYYVFLPFIDEKSIHDLLKSEASEYWEIDEDSIDESFEFIAEIMQVELD